MWYVIQVLSGQEDKACELINLHAAGQRSKDGRPVLKECFVPRYQVELARASEVMRESGIPPTSSARWSRSWTSRPRARAW